MNRKSKTLKASETSGYLGDLSEHQQAQLDELKAYINLTKKGHDNPWFDDMYLLKFLRARQFDLERTKKMWDQLIEFRIQYDAEKIIQTFNFHEQDLVARYFEFGLFGCDKIGRPIMVCRNGMADTTNLFKIIEQERYWQMLVWFFEKITKHKMLACSELYDRQIHQIFAVLDLTGFGVSKWTKLNIILTKKFLEITQNAYPELMGKLFICSAPLVFTSIYSMIKGWLDEPTKKKIQIIGSNYQSELFKYCDEDQIPTCLGGTCQHKFTDDFGPWNEYEYIDGPTYDQIGVRRIGDPNAKIFGPKDMMKLENPLVKGEGTWGTKGAVKFDRSGKMVPNEKATKTEAINIELLQNNDERKS